MPLERPARGPSCARTCWTSSPSSRFPRVLAPSAPPVTCSKAPQGERRERQTLVPCAEPGRPGNRARPGRSLRLITGIMDPLPVPLAGHDQGQGQAGYGGPPLPLHNSQSPPTTRARERLPHSRCTGGLRVLLAGVHGPAVRGGVPVAGGGVGELHPGAWCKARGTFRRLRLSTGGFDSRLLGPFRGSRAGAQRGLQNPASGDRHLGVPPSSL